MTQLFARESARQQQERLPSDPPRLSQPSIVHPFDVQWEGQWLRTGVCTYRLPGSEKTWEVVRRTGTVNSACNGVEIVAVTRGPLPSSERCLVLIENFRPTVGRLCVEWPAGLVDPSESPSDAAIRELKEETGYTGTLLREEESVSCVDPWKSTETTKVVHLEVDLADPINASVEQEAEENEFINVFLVPLSRLREEIHRDCLLSSFVQCFLCGLEAARLLV